MTQTGMPPAENGGIGDDALANIRAAVLERILWIVLTFGGLAVVAASIEGLVIKRYALAAFYVPVYMLVVVSFASRRVPYWARACILLAMFYAVGMSELWYFGLGGQGFLFLFAVVTFSGMLFRLRVVLAAFGVSICSIILVALVYCLQIVPVVRSEQEASIYLHSWVTVTMSFLMLSSASMALLALIFRGLERSIQSSGEYLAGLRAEVVERKKAEQQFRTVVEASKDAMVAINHRGKVFLFNPAAERMFGISAERAIGNPPDNLMPEELDAQHKTFVAEFFSGHGGRGVMGTTLEVSAVRADGAHFPVELSLSEGHLGKDPFVLAMVRDISERKRAEEEKDKLEAQLFHAQKMEAVGTLAGGIAHDFNNILGAIVGFSELALNDVPEDSQQARNSIGEVLSAGKRASELVRQILTFSRQTEYAPKPIRLQPVVQEGLRMLRETIPSTIVFCSDIQEDCPAVMADATRAHQVLINLCTNAFHAMEEEGGTLSVSLTPVCVTREQASANLDLKPGQYCCLTVADSGKGMDAATRERIFDPFFTTKVEGKGTGLGLATVHGIVKSHGGAILVESAPGHGTTFSVFFPAVKEHAEDILEELAPPPAGQGERLLLVDDERVIVNMCTRALTALGYQVSGFLKAEEALEEFLANPAGFDALLTDQVMPEMTGTDLARRALSCKPDLPVLLITGTGNAELAQEARDAGIRQVLPKPLGMIELARTLRELFKERQG